MGKQKSKEDLVSIRATTDKAPSDKPDIDKVKENFLTYIDTPKTGLEKNVADNISKHIQDLLNKTK